MLWVKYRFDPGQKMLFIYQRSVTRLEDLAIAETDSGVKHAEEGLPVSQIQGISDFRLAYAVESLYDPDDSKQWQNNWDCGAESVGVPFGLMLKMTIGEGARSRSFYMDLSDWRSTVCKPFWGAVIPEAVGWRQKTEDSGLMTAGGFCHLSSTIRHPSSSTGSVLVMVLWILVLVSFLAGQYLAHNREKADISQNAWTAFRQRQAVFSIIQLYSTDAWPIPDGTGADGRWFRLSPDDIALWVRVDKESLRTNLNTASDGEIKQKMALMMGDDFQRQADVVSDAVSDAVLDWRDADNLKRMRGAEEKDYEAKGLSFRPANGPFNVMSELLLVSGVTSDMFWGNPLNSIESDLSSYYDQAEKERIPRALSEGFTIYSGQSKRISLLVPGNENGYLYMNIIMSKESGRLAVVDSQQFLGVAEQGFDRLIELETEVRGLEARGKKRS